MQRWAVKLVAGGLVVGVLIGPMAGRTAPVPQDVAVLQKQYDEAQQEIARLRQTLSQAREEITRLRQQLEAGRGGAPAGAPAAASPMSYGDAIAALTRQIDADPHQAAPYAKRGAVYTHLGEHALALDDLNRAVSLDPQAATIYNQRGIVHYQLGQYAPALQDFNQAIARAPQMGEAYHNRGIVHQTRGDYPKAHADLSKAADLGLTHASQTLQELRTDVRRLQDRLRQAGLAPGPTDGVPGTQTVAALQAYQRRQGLPITARIDSKTQQALGLHAQNAAQPNSTSAVLDRFVKRPTPPYPLQAREQGWEGKVTLRFEMRADGTIGAIEVVRSSGHTLLDSSARDTLKTWTHRPIVHDGQAATQWATLDFDFKLDDSKPSAP